MQSQAMRVAGLTGGIASGKSTATRLFRKESIPVIDCDDAARHVVRQVIAAMQAEAGPLVAVPSEGLLLQSSSLQGTAGYQRVVNLFGQEVLSSTGEQLIKSGRRSLSCS